METQKTEVIDSANAVKKTAEEQAAEVRQWFEANSALRVLKNSPNTKADLDAMIKSYSAAIIIFSNKTCPYCAATFKFLASLDTSRPYISRILDSVPIIQIDIDKDPLFFQELMNFRPKDEPVSDYGLPVIAFISDDDATSWFSGFSIESILILLLKVADWRFTQLKAQLKDEAKIGIENHV